MQFLENGYEIVAEFISQNWLGRILDEIESAEFPDEVIGVRHINKKLQSVAEYINSKEFKEKASPYVPVDAQLVRAILFNKTPESNWFVTWHQDRTVAVSCKFDEPGWGPWSVKENVLHVQPPMSVLEKMVTIRVHLDPAPKENGCLKVIPDSHKLGLLSPEQISQVVNAKEAYFCEAKRGAALIMRPHLLHASSKSAKPNNRRVLHFEFYDWQLPDVVSWG